MSYLRKERRSQTDTPFDELGDTSTLRGGLVISIYDPFICMEDYFDKAIEFGNLYRAMKKSCRNVRWKDSVVGYEANGLKNTYLLRQDLLNGKYKLSPYQYFKIYESKEREIIATRIRDRQFQKSLCTAGLYEDITEHLVHNDGACQTGKGTDFTLDRLTAHLRRYYNEHGTDGWVLKCDIRKYFPSTPHSTAKAAIAKRISDKRAEQVVISVIESFGGDVGVGLGSQISQLVELAVLDDLDHFIKERLRVKHYLRYMDDFLLIHPDKEYLQYCLSEIRRIVESFGLELNKKTTLYPLRQGVKMMNWRFVIAPDTGRILRYMNGKKMGKQRRKMRKLNEKEATGQAADGTTFTSLTSWMANAKRGTTFRQRQQMYHYYYQLKGGNKNEYSEQRTDEVGENGSNVQPVEK